jgi:hypothetical protein
MQAAMNKYKGFSMALKLSIAELAAILGFGKLCPKNKIA